MADLRALYTEEAVGANHPTKADVINRLTLAYHNNDGTPKLLAALAHKNGTNQTDLASGAFTLLTWATAAIDPLGIVNLATDSIVPNLTGYFRFGAVVQFSNVADGKLFGIDIRLNNTTIAQDLQLVGSGSNAVAKAITPPVLMNGTTDAVQVFGQHNLAGLGTAIGSSWATYFWAEFVGK